jgi:hypothetical protein
VGGLEGQAKRKLAFFLVAQSESRVPKIPSCTPSFQKPIHSCTFARKPSQRSFSRIKWANHWHSSTKKLASMKIDEQIITVKAKMSKKTESSSTKHAPMVAY